MTQTNMATIFFNAGVLGATYTRRKAVSLAAAKALAAELLPGVIIEAGAPQRSGRSLRPTLVFNLFSPDANWIGSTPGKRPVGIITL